MQTDVFRPERKRVVPSVAEIREAVAVFLQRNEAIASAIRQDIRDARQYGEKLIADEDFIGHGSNCRYFLLRHLREEGYDVDMRECVGAHTLFSVGSSEGIVWIDPDLGSLVEYPEIFVGTTESLRQVFLDPARSFYLHDGVVCGRSLAGREEWFHFLYDL